MYNTYNTEDTIFLFVQRSIAHYHNAGSGMKAALNTTPRNTSNSRHGPESELLKGMRFTKE